MWSWLCLCRLLHDGITDAFPCDGTNMHCVTAHAGAVVVNGPASINTAAPLVCADQTAGSCLSGYVDMPSCLADIASGMTSCFVYLRADARGLGAVTPGAGQSFEVHGAVDLAALLELQAGWVVASAASLVLADVRLVGGSGGVAAVSVASGGELSLVRVEVESGGAVSFSGSVTVTECVLTGTDLIGSTSFAVLTLSGGTLTGLAVSMSGGFAVLGGSCVLVDSPVSIVAGTLSVSPRELRSDGSSVPLTVGRTGTATVTGVVFRSSAGNFTAVSVMDGGA